ncbi:MAG: GNAT family N-acetyltransferase [Actinomycetota bacterium]|nr:GNAT family N-acetyltransferase [Actinomycetota bacterium]
MVADVSRARHTPDVAFREGSSDRLVIRRFRAADAASLAAYRSDPATARYQSWDIPYSHAQARSFIESLEATNPDSPGEWFQFAVIEAATGVHIGDVAACVDADDPRLATIGVTLATSARGRGYASEAVAWLLDYLFLDRQKHRVTADCDARNSNAAALLDHLRMRREAHHLQSAWWKGEWVDEYVYALLAPEWLERRPAAEKSGPRRPAG